MHGHATVLSLVNENRAVIRLYLIIDISILNLYSIAKSPQSCRLISLGEKLICCCFSLLAIGCCCGCEFRFFLWFPWKPPIFPSAILAASSKFRLLEISGS
ncbi:hypothetical protein SLA2020_234580 [Shorea laevis]